MKVDPGDTLAFLRQREAARQHELDVRYFSFDYDWERLELVRSKYLACRGPVRGELAAYSAYLQRLAREAR